MELWSSPPAPGGPPKTRDLTDPPRRGAGGSTGAGDYQRLLVPWRPVEVERQVEAQLGRAVTVTVTANRSTMVRVLPEAGAVRLRLHSMFLYAPPAILAALARYARRPHDLEANEALDVFIRGERHRTLEPERGRASSEGDDLAGGDPAPLVSRGERYDLQEILQELNRRFFGASVAARITWSRGSAERRRRSILFGSYWRAPGDEVGLIKIHPALDADWVPRGFVEFVVFHEMLHAVIPARCEDGRRAFHPPEFRRAERAYPTYAEWRRWEKENLGRFLGKR